MRGLILLCVLLGARPATADELKPWPGPTESKPKDPPPEPPPPPPTAEEKPKPAPAKPPTKAPPAEPSPDPVDECIDGCDVLRAEGLKACKDGSSLPPPKDCRGNISNAAAECIKQCRGY